MILLIFKTRKIEKVHYYMTNKYRHLCTKNTATLRPQCKKNTLYNVQNDFYS